MNGRTRPAILLSMIRTRLGVLALAALLGAAPGEVVGQSPPQPPPTNSCSLAARSSVARAEGLCVLARQGLLPPAEDVGTWWVLGPFRGRILPTEVRATYRSAFPSDRNDGAPWAGRGLSAALLPGWQLRWDRFHLALAPALAWSQNRAFQVPDTVPPGWSAWADPWGVPGWDGYLRPGPGRVLEADLGDSFLEARWERGRAGASHERLWWGPARRYPLLFSGTGPGFPHLYGEVVVPVPRTPGEARITALAGRLTESPWFDADEGNDQRVLFAGQASWRLGFVPGLEAALSLVHHTPWSDGRTAGDGATLGTLSFRAAFPDEGVEAYGEVGRGALFVNPVEGVSETDHALVYTLGMTRTDTTASGTPWRFWGEITKQALELPQPAGDPGHAYATTPSPLQGHTHRGRPLGSYIGPGSNAQAVGVDYPGGSVAWGIFAERIRRDDDTYYRVWQNNYGFFGHDLEWTLGARGGTEVERREWGRLRVHVEGGVSRRKNRSFVGLDGVNWTFHREWNRWMDLRVLWIPG